MKKSKKKGIKSITDVKFVTTVFNMKGINAQVKKSFGSGAYINLDRLSTLLSNLVIDYIEFYIDEKKKRIFLIIRTIAKTSTGNKANKYELRIPVLNI